MLLANFLWIGHDMWGWLIGGAFLLLASFITVYVPLKWQSDKLKQSVEDVHKEIRTNNGHNAAHYLESAESNTAELLNRFGMIEAQMDAIPQMVVSAIAKSDEKTERLIGQHTIEDQNRFKEITEGLEANQAANRKIQATVDGNTAIIHVLAKAVDVGFDTKESE